MATQGSSSSLLPVSIPHQHMAATMHARGMAQASGSTQQRVPHQWHPSARLPHHPSTRTCSAQCTAESSTTPQQHHHHATVTVTPQETRSCNTPLPAPPSTPAVSSSITSTTPAAMAAAAMLVALVHPEAASALQMEPANALSLPTWAIHVSSVVEWVIAMGLMWRYAEVSGNQRWKGMTWGMLPALGSASCACTWHLFYNSPDLEFLVALQALLTVVGNTTCMFAAYRIWETRSEPSSS